MPNQIDYKQDVNSIARGAGVLRFAANILDPIILEIDAAEFAYTNDDIVEMHLYEIRTNRLIASAYIPLSDGFISSRVYNNEPVEYRQRIVFEMTGLVRKYFASVRPGMYDITINFFSNILGHEKDKLQIVETSPSRKEIAIEYPYQTLTDQQLMRIAEFVPPSVNKRLAQGIIEQLFDTDNVLDNTAQSYESLTTPDINGATRNTQAGIRLQYIDQYNRLLSFMPNLLDNIYKNAIQKLVNISKTDYRIQQEQLQLLINEAIVEEVGIFIRSGHFDARVQVS